MSSIRGNAKRTPKPDSFILPVLKRTGGSCMIRFHGAPFLIIMLGATMAYGLPDDSAYAECLLTSIPAEATEAFVNTAKLACRIKHPSEWIDTGRTLTCTSPQTRNMHNVRVHAGCESSSPEGKYCADLVEINCSMTPDDRSEYRFQRHTAECPHIEVASGPSGGWYQIISCSLSQDQTGFKAIIKGWTHPQAFKTNLSIQTRYR